MRAHKIQKHSAIGSLSDLNGLIPSIAIRILLSTPTSSTAGHASLRYFYLFPLLGMLFFLMSYAFTLGPFCRSEDYLGPNSGSAILCHYRTWSHNTLCLVTIIFKTM